MILHQQLKPAVYGYIPAVPTISWVGAAGRVGMSTSIEEVAAAELPDAKVFDAEFIS